MYALKLPLSVNGESKLNFFSGNYVEDRQFTVISAEDELLSLE